MRESPADTKVSAEGCGTPADHAKAKKIQTKEETTHPAHFPHLSEKPQTPQNCVVDDDFSR